MSDFTLVFTLTAEAEVIKAPPKVDAASESDEC